MSSSEEEVVLSGDEGKEEALDEPDRSATVSSSRIAAALDVRSDPIVVVSSALPEVSSNDFQGVEPAATVPHPAIITRTTSLNNLSLHSPSDIVGTPFDIISPRFEYPFPPVPDSTLEPRFPLSSSLPTLPSPLSSLPNPPSRDPFAPSSPPSLTHFPHSFPLPPPPPSVNYSSTHPKLRTREPPVPPGLVRKRRKLELRGRSSSLDSDASYEESSGTTPSVGSPTDLELLPEFDQEGNRPISSGDEEKVDGVPLEPEDLTPPGKQPRLIMENIAVHAPPVDGEAVNEDSAKECAG